MSDLQQFIQETEMAAEVADNVVSIREARARRIRELAQQWADNTIQLGLELRGARDTFPQGPRSARPGWREWLQAEVGVSESYARNLIQVAEKFKDLATDGSAVASYKVMALLTRSGTPDEAVDEVIQRIKSGEQIGHGKAKNIIQAVKTNAPSAEQARQIARETGQPTLARDGNIYLGATKAQEKEIEARRTMVFDVRRAVETLSGMRITADEFIKQAPDHLLWNHDEETLINDALTWLTDLLATWEQR